MVCKGMIPLFIYSAVRNKHCLEFGYSTFVMTLVYIGTIWCLMALL